MAKNFKNGSKRKPSTKFVKEEREETKIYESKGGRRSKDNDVAWYAQSPELLKSAASISMNNATGATMSLIGDGVNPAQIARVPKVPDPSGFDNFDHSKVHVPGLLVLRVAQCAGVAKDNSSPVNVAAKNIYTWVRHMNSGAKNYNSPDLMLYVLAVSQAYAFYSYLTRIYGVLNLYSQVNRYLPRILIKAMGVNPDEMVRRMPDLHYYINMYANKLGALCIPNNMPLVWRHTWMYSGIYSDGDNQKSQLYMYVPRQFLYFKPTAEQTGGSLDAYMVPDEDSNAWSFDDLVTAGDTLLNSIIADEDMNIMSGDIKKAYGENGLMKVPEIERSYRVIPSYSPEVLSQMQNATVVPCQSIKIKQDINKNCLVNEFAMFSPSKSMAKNWLGGGLSKVFNLYGEDSSPERVMVASRLVTTMKESVQFATDHSVEKVSYTIDQHGTEIVVSETFYNNYPETNKVGTGTNYRSFGAMNQEVAIMRTKFAYAPLWMYAVLGAKLEGDVYYPVGIMGDLDNWTVLSENTVKKLHETATLSELAVPLMGMAK